MYCYLWKRYIITAEQIHAVPHTRMCCGGIFYSIKWNKTKRKKFFQFAINFSFSSFFHNFKRFRSLRDSFMEMREKEAEMEEDNDRMIVQVVCSLL